MPFYPYKTDGLVTMMEAAKLVGVQSNKLRRLVYEKNLVDAPATPVGKREYYNQEQLQVIMQQVANLRKAEVI